MQKSTKARKYVHFEAFSNNKKRTVFGAFCPELPFFCPETIHLMPLQDLCVVFL